MACEILLYNALMACEILLYNLLAYTLWNINYGTNAASPRRGILIYYACESFNDSHFPKLEDIT